MRATREEMLIVFPFTARIIFQTIVWPIVMVGLFANVAVVFRIFFNEKGKSSSSLKPFYRSALLSLAISDILLLLTSGTNILVTIDKGTILWLLPNWCCNFIPYLQTVAVLVTSLTLAGVAIDRYAAMRSRIPSTSKGMLEWQWSIATVMGLWAISFGASYPILGTYAAEPLVVKNNSTYYMGTLCIAANRNEVTVAYTALFAAIFVPLGIVFVLVHVLLARNICQRNSPVSKVNQRSTKNSDQFSNENSTVSTSLGKPRNPTIKKNIPTPSHVARKRRTVRIILVLIIVFVICRLPQWSFLLYKLHSTTMETYSWYIQIILTSLSLFNAALDPFLYAFLNEALSLVTWIRESCTRIRAKPSNNDVRAIYEEEIASTISAKIPRGPYHSS